MESAEVVELKEKLANIESILKGRTEQLHRVDLDERRYERRVRSVKIAVTLSLLIMLVFSIIPVGYNLFRSNPSLRTAEINGDSKLNELFRNTTAKELREINAFVAKLRADSDKSSPEEISRALFETDLRLLKERIILLEKSISDSPEKALSIPLLRRDQESMSKSIEANKFAISNELSRIYDQQKWMLTGIGTALLAALTALAGALYKTVGRAPD
ncbi:hypothetical protein [Pseudomonas crudilactis]|uniref:hypothetical protein n=1 Tax=Pseudomonas crudilactis TaxID=2697028 RepID=UPI0015DA130E|nr:hypothetical protein [Pseudomonas crudilactis]